jgi:hypothetical protein
MRSLDVPHSLLAVLLAKADYSLHQVRSISSLTEQAANDRTSGESLCLSGKNNEITLLLQERATAILVHQTQARQQSSHRSIQLG